MAANSLKKFFDEPLTETAANPHKFYSFFDQPQETMIARSFGDVQVMGQNMQMKRQSQFATTGPVAPLRVPLPDRFSPGGRVINREADSDCCIRPDRCIGGRGKSLPDDPRQKRPKTPEDTSYAQLGVTHPEYMKIKEILKDKSYNGTWNAEKLMPASHRRVQNKAEALYNINKRKEYSKKCEMDNHIFMMNMTHPKGIAGVETPLQSDSIVYAGKAHKLNHKNDVRRVNKSLRYQRLSAARSAESGLMYQVPETEFSYKFKTNPMTQSMGRNPNPSQEDTFLRLFSGCHNLSEAEIQKRKSRLQTGAPTGKATAASCSPGARRETLGHALH